MPERPDIYGGEFDIIRDFFAPLTTGNHGSLGLTDDAAVLGLPAGKELAITADTLVCDVHFRRNDPARTVAHKLLAVNLSDLAAMGATPYAYTLAVAWPGDLDLEWIKDFAAGLGAAQEHWRIDLVGGDTVRTPGPMTLNLTAFGFIETGRALTRSSVCDGDRLFVSGSLGDAALGLRVLQGELAPDNTADRHHLIERYQQPTPRIALGGRLIGTANAAIDISDGLLADVGHMARASGVDIQVNAGELPLSEPAEKLISGTPELLKAAYAGGDDYELVFAVPADRSLNFANLSRELKLPITEIGHAMKCRGDNATVKLMGTDEVEINVTRTGYRHF